MLFPPLCGQAIQNRDYDQPRATRGSLAAFWCGAVQGQRGTLWLNSSRSTVQTLCSLSLNWQLGYGSKNPQSVSGSATDKYPS
jgi:hypothetical protein